MVNHNEKWRSSHRSSWQEPNSNHWHRLFPCVNLLSSNDCRPTFSVGLWRKHHEECAYMLPPGITLIGSFERYVGQLNSMIIGSDGCLYTGCDCAIVWIWNKVEVFRSFYANSGPVTDIVVGAGGQVITSHYDGTIKVWKYIGKDPPFYDKVVSLPTREDRIVNMFRRLKYNSWSLYKHNTPISCLCLSEDKRFVYSGSWDHTVKMWRLSDWRLVESIKGHAQKVNTIATGADGLMFSGSNDGSIRMFRTVEGRKRDVPTNQFVCALLSERIAVHALLYTSIKDGSGQLFAGLADGTLRYWQQKTGWRHHIILSYHKKAVTCVAGLPRSSLVFSGSLDCSIGVWSSERYNHKPLMVLTPCQGSVHCLAVREDWEENVDGPRRLILYSNGQDGTIKMWRIARGETLITNA